MKHFSNINLNLNELQNAVIQNLNMVPITSSDGQIYYDTSINKLKLKTPSGWVIITSGGSGGPETLDQVLTNGNVSQINAFVGDIGIYNNHVPSGNGYVYITGSKNIFHFYNNIGTEYAQILQDAILLKDFGSIFFMQIKKPTSITAARTATFQDASGTVAYLSDIPSLTGFVPYIGATQAVNLGAYDLTVNGLTVGRGGGSYYANTAFGVAAGSVNTSGINNSFIGFGAGGDNTTGSYNTTVGVQTLYLNQVGDNNTAIGANALYFNTVSNITAIGHNSLSSSTTGSFNTAVGVSSGTALTTGSVNTFLGHFAGSGVTTASYNTFIGNYVGFSNNTGSYNTGGGSNTLQFNTTGTYNAAFGLASNRSNTTGIGNATFGAYSAYSNITGSYNAHLGYGTAYFMTSGSNNVFLGLYAGRLISGGANNLTSNNSIFLGANTNALADNQTNQIVIGNGVTGAGSNTVTIGDTSIITTRLRGNIQGGAFVKDGGTSSQFLKADGSVDSSTYLNGSGTVGYIPKFSSASGITNSVLQDSGTGTITLDATPTNLAALALKSGSGQASLVQYFFNNTVRFQTGSDASGNYRINVYDAGGSFVNCALYVPSATTRVLINSVTDDGVNNLQVNGSLIATSIKKTGGTNLQYLLADGSVSTGPSLTGFVPYTGATQAVDLGAYNLTVNSISVGKGAGTGINNTAIGNSVLVSNTTGTYNVAIGFEALKVNTTGGTNIAIGRGTMPFNTTGGGNTALGYNSMFSNTSGGNNVSIGNGVMTGNTTGSGNVAIGYNTLTVQSTVSNTVAIGQGALQFNNGGTLNTAVGYASLTANTSGSNNTALGASALQNNNTGSDNTALGMYVLLNNNSGTGNTGVGKESLRANTTGGYNVGLGRFSLYSNTTGEQNTATGASALSSITTGSFNVGVGVNSMSNSTTGSNNVAVGYNSIQGTFGASNTGYNNVGIGYYGLRNNTSGFENIGIGYNSLLSNPTDNNCIVIGSNATGAGSNTVTLGNTSITTTRLRGAVQGGSFVKDGGTASQYLMADGSVTTGYKYNFSGSVTLTGTLTTTNLLTITIPANSLSDYLDLRSLMVQQSGPALAGFQIRVWHNSVNDFNTATRIANYAFGAGGADLFAQMTRRFSIQSGTLFGFPSTPSNATGEGSNSNAALSIAFDPTVINYLFVSVQLNNVTDTATLRNVNITN